LNDIIEWHGIKIGAHGGRSPILTVGCAKIIYASFLDVCHEMEREFLRLDEEGKGSSGHRAYIKVNWVRHVGKEVSLTSSALKNHRKRKGGGGVGIL